MEKQIDQQVIRQATQCAVVYGKHDMSEQTTSVLDMATTGEIPEGYTHLIFVVINGIGYVVSRNLEGLYKVEIHDQIPDKGKDAVRTARG